jgi:competence protein ComEA
MSMATEPSESTGPQLTLRAADQCVAAGLVCCCLVALLAHWWWRGGWHSELMEVERVKPGTIPYVVDVNQADWPELVVLPGMGETLARRIVNYRETAGPFRSIAELEKINGIGPRTLARLRPYLKPIAEVEATADVPSANKPKS